jgi:two-component system, OmpR family, response regulator MprA
VLLVDDDEHVHRALRRALQLEGFEVEQATDGAEALVRLASSPVDVVVLDVSLPVLDGLEVCRELRRRDDPTPILLHTARDSVADRVAGLDAGADDYLTKPVALSELLARMWALLRRSLPSTDSTLRYHDLELDRRAHRVHRGGRQITLTATEFDLLAFLLVKAEVVLSRTVITGQIWGHDGSLGSNTLDVYIGHLRRKTEATGEPRLIQTVRGVGFVLRDR